MAQDFHLNDWGAGVHVFRKSKLCDSELLLPWEWALAVADSRKSLGCPPRT